jgi:hypothetical protein
MESEWISQNLNPVSNFTTIFGISPFGVPARERTEFRGAAYTFSPQIQIANRNFEVCEKR